MSIGIKFRSLRGIYSQFKFSLSTLVVFSGLVVLLLGAMVLLGWYTHNTSLIQINPVFVPMQYNTAIGFFMSGIALLFLNTNCKKVSVWIGSVVLLFGLITLLEYILGLDLFIDQLFMDHYITIKTSTPGRMAPNTALCFTITGFAALYPALFEHKRDVPAILGLVGALIFGLGLVAFTGYFLEMETTYGWGKLTNMAIHTAAGFIVIGSGYTFLSWKLGKLSRSSLPHWLPFPILIACLTITISIWQSLHVQERNIVAQFGSEYANLSDNFILVFGILLSVALAFSIRKIIIARSRLQERLKAEKALSESEIKLRNMLESSRDAIGVSKQGTHTLVNPAYLQLFGYDREEELIGTSILDCIAPSERDKITKNVLGRTRGKNASTPYETRGLRKDGSEFIMDVHISTYKLNDEDFTFVILRDITERKLTEEQLKKHREHLEELVKERTTELEEKNHELERFYKATIDREYRMKELRDENDKLRKQFGQIDKPN